MTVEMRLWWFYCECGHKWSATFKKWEYTDHLPTMHCLKCHRSDIKGGL